MITARIVDISLDGNGNIQVTTDYKDELGNLIQKGTTRYSTSSTPTEAELNAKITAEINDHCQALMIRKYFKGQNNTVLDNVKASMLGQQITVSQATAKLGSNIVTINDTGIIDSQPEVI